ncbi:spore coat protein CotH [Cohnella sp. CFH 77786]|uniref:CotH kinase family protein n=1 Tax=Cohnella sp. CFH 77786 TaxID=2662265 RepID=UPI001C60FE71|nr:CotH kinase family protein [Cohnella sp. CFH 77786]MBW5445059.1 spore coat protein CotH [Cohnella sp. CFH 77786]
MALPVRTLKLSESADRELERNLWTDRYVTCAMRVNGQTERTMVRYRGGHTREYPKRSYDVVLGGETYHYNAEFDDPSMIRNALSFAFFPMLGVPAPRCRHVLLYRNGDPQGVYLEIESVGKRFFRRRGIGALSLFYAVNNNANFGLYRHNSESPKSSLLSGYEYRFGGEEERKRFASFIRSVNNTDERLPAAGLSRSLDVDNYLRWLAGAVLTGNYDGFEQNYAVYRHSRTGKYRIIPWDYEGTWGRNCYGQIQDDDLVPIRGYNELTRRLLDYRPYRRMYRDILIQALKGPFTERKIMPIANKMLSELSPHVRQDVLSRWSYSEFLGEAELIRRHIRVRREIVTRELDGLL